MLPVISMLARTYQSITSSIEKEFDILIPQSSSLFFTFLNYCQANFSFLECCPFYYRHLQNRVWLGIEEVDLFYPSSQFYQFFKSSKTLTKGVVTKQWFSRLMWAIGLIHFFCLICSNSYMLAPGMDWFSSPCTDVTLMGKRVRIVVLPETPTVLGMEMLAQDMHPLPKGQGAPPSHMSFSYRSFVLQFKLKTN